MTRPAIIECTVHFHRRGQGARQQLQASAEPLPPPERIPRLARLLALAHRCETLLRTGVVKDYATLARLGHVSRARICQLVGLLQLAPDIQEEILFLSGPERGRGSLHLRQLRPIAAVLDWSQQRRRWRKLRLRAGKKTSMLFTGGA